MKIFRIALTFTLGLLAPIASAQVPQLLNYQGRVVVGTTNFDSTGQFKFALVNSNGTVSFWSNDGTSAAGSQPTASVSLSVVKGLYAILLGDTAIAGMPTALPATVFTNFDVRLRVWFNDGATGFQQFTPDQRIAAVGYALIAANVPDGAITSNKLAAGSVTAAKIADGTITSSKLAPNTVTSSNIADTIALGTTNTNGRLDVYRTSASTPAITLLGSSSQISTYGSDGLEQIRLWGPSYGELLLNNSLANNATAVKLTAQGSTGGQLELRNTNGSTRALLEGENTGGLLTLYAADGGIGAILYGNEGQGSGSLSLRNTNGSARFRAYGGPAAGSMNIFNASGTETVDIAAEPDGIVTLRNSAGSTRAYMTAGGTQGGEIRNYEEDGTLTTIIHNVSDAGVVSVRNSSGVETGYLWGRNIAGQTGGQIGLKNSLGAETIILNASDANGDGRITTQVLQITGGADLSENFEINADKGTLEPGMIVSIDPKNIGELVLSRTACDKKVAGVLSGGGGVKTGMLMGQAGTKADGKHPVALTGRVYCWVDADIGGAVEAGDLITTSNTPGHGMKVTNHALASGAIIGKAMSSLEKGKGLVLVLVSLQ